MLLLPRPARPAASLVDVAPEAIRALSRADFVVQNLASPKSARSVTWIAVHPGRWLCTHCWWSWN
jgi:hypothetical protein